MLIRISITYLYTLLDIIISQIYDNISNKRTIYFLIFKRGYVSK